MRKLILFVMAFLSAGTVLGDAIAQSNITSDRLDDLIEFRRYRVKAPVRDEFVTLFDAYVPVAHAQTGSWVYGQFVSPDDPELFVWIRGYESIAERTIGRAAFYGGPVWAEHGDTFLSYILDFSDVIATKPASVETAIPLLPSVDLSAQKTPVIARRQTGLPGVESLDRQKDHHTIKGTRQADGLSPDDFQYNSPEDLERYNQPVKAYSGVLPQREKELSARDSLTGVNIMPDAFEDTGVVVLQVFPLQKGRVDDFLSGSGRDLILDYENLDIRTLAVHRSVDEPLQSVRDDGPFVVYLGVVQNARQYSARVLDVLERHREKIQSSGLLRSAIETHRLIPTARSRIRWID